MKPSDSEFTVEAPWWFAEWLDCPGDNAEIRALWYPEESPALAGGWVRGGVSAWEDDVRAELRGARIIVIDTTIDSLAPGPKAALLWVFNISRVARPRDPEAMALEALGVIERKLCSEGLI